MASTTARRVGRYEILREIGRGGMATVYLARQVDLQREAALKELALFDRADPALARRFLREARLAGSLGHPNIVAIKGIKLSGFIAWITWLAVHLFYLVGFQNRLLVLIRWSINFATRGRGARLITNPADAEAAARPAAHPEPRTTLLMPPSEGSHLSPMR